MFDNYPLCGTDDHMRAMINSFDSGSGDDTESLWPEPSPQSPEPGEEPGSPVDAPPSSPAAAPPASPVDAPPSSPIPPKTGNASVTVTLVFAVESTTYNATLLKAIVRAQFDKFAATVEVTLGALVLTGARHLLATGSVTTTVVLTGADATAVLALANSDAFRSACAAAGVTGVAVTVTSQPTTPLQPPVAASSTSGNQDLLGLLALLVIPVAGAGGFAYYKVQQRKAGSSSTLEHVLVVAPEEPPTAAAEEATA